MKAEIKQRFSSNKFLIGIIFATIAIIISGAFFLGKTNKKVESQSTNFDPTSLVQNAKRTIGNSNAPVKIVEFGDIQCPACKQAQPIVENVLANNSSDVYFVFRHFPLTIHKNSQIAAQAAEAAGEQGKFFEMIHIQYLKQSEWADKTNPRDDFRKYAQELNLDLGQFNSDMEKDKGNIKNDYALGNRAGAKSTPTFFINGKIYPGVIKAEEFETIIKSNLPPKEAT